MNRGNVPLGSQVIDDHRLYLGELYNQTIVERKWLNKIFKDNLMESRSVLLIADPGYGKTSLTSQLVCANQSSLWLSVRETVIFYHICRFDRSSTQKPSEFIIKMANALMNKFDIIGNFYETNIFAREYLNEEYRCSKDPVSCFDYLILHPTLLYHKEFPNRTYTLIIDALDECQTTDEKYDIVELLWMHITKFPRYLKFFFILTSRNIEEIVSKFDKMNSFDVVNINEYRQEFGEDIFSYISKREISLPSNINKTEIVKVFNGNFLYAKYFLDYCFIQHNCEPSDVPSSLEDYFELNLRRIFGKSAEQFEKVRAIFEVLAATSKPITEEMLLTISASDHNVNMYSVISKQLRHFVSVENKNSIFFKHKAFRDFLINYSNRHSPFYIDKNIGHKRFAAYLLQSLNTSKNVDVVELANHVALSKNQHFEKMFLMYAYDMLYPANMSMASYVHNVAKNFNCYDTMVLMIKLIGAGHIDDEDKENQTASFIAAEIGNEYSLNALLEFGANIDFVKSCDRKDRIELYDHFSCGYSLAEVAAKRGNYKAVKILLKRKPKLIDHKNINRQNVIHIAAENGQLVVVKEILQMNFTKTDTYALYLAAQNGFYDIVDVILKNNVTDTCMPCNGTFYWKNKIKVNEKSDKNVESYWIWPYEIRLFKCETALHVALNKGHLNIVKRLLNEKLNSLQCRNVAGLTPLLQAVESNQFDIFVHLYKNGANITDRCSGSVNFVDGKITWHFSMPPPEIPFYQSGTTISHLLARYDNTQITKYLISIGISKWLYYDDKGASTVHYALCYGSKKFISVIENKLNFSIALLEKTKDGHTPYQYAAKCGNPLDTPMYFEGRQHDIQDDFDIFGRSLLQLSIMHTSPNDVTTSAKHFDVAISLKHDLFHLDNDKQNVLHYAAAKGNAEILDQAAIHLSERRMQKMLAQRNNCGFIPLSLSVQAFRYEYQCSCNNDSIAIGLLLFGGQRIKPIQPDHQLKSFIHFFHHSYVHSTVTFGDIQSYVLSLLKTRQALPLLYFRFYYTDEFTYITSKHIDLEGIDCAKDLFASHSSMVYIFLPPNITEYCNNRNKNGFLHRIVMNYRDKFWKSFENSLIWEKYFKDYNAKTLNQCFDNDGYNILQRAIAGGNSLVVSILLDKDLSLTVANKLNESVLKILLKSVPFFIYNSLTYKTATTISINIPFEYSLKKPETIWTMIDHKLTGQTNFTSGFPVMDFLRTLKLLIGKIKKTKYPNMKTIVKIGDVCPLHKRKFGLVHVASAKGYLEFVEFAAELYGKKVIKCTDLHSISPKYLALLFNQGHVMSWISDLDLTDMYPSKRIQHLLAGLYVTNLNYRPNVHWTCFLRFSYKKSNLIQRQLNQCTNQLIYNTDMCVLCSQNHMNANYRHFKSIFNIILRYNYKRFNSSIKTILKTKNHETMHRNVLYLYKLLRDVLYFGFGDRKMIYTMLSYDLKVRTNLTQGITYVKQMDNDTNYFREITFHKDEYAPWIRAKMIHMMEIPVQCTNIREHERAIKSWSSLAAKHTLLEWAENVYCKGNKTCELRKDISDYFNKTMLCQKNAFNLFFNFDNLYTVPFVKASVTINHKLDNKTDSVPTDMTDASIDEDVMP